MAIFAYTARKRSGEKAEGSIDAADRRAALLQLDRLGLVPVSVAEQSAAARPKAKRHFALPGTTPRMGSREALIFTTELSDLLAAGMTLGNALNVLARRGTGRARDRIIEELRDEIIRGSSLSDALSRHPRTFPHLYVSMVRAGETSGSLEEVLRRLVAHYERIQEVKEKVTMALVYPAVVVVVGVAVLVFTMWKVVPNFEKVFNDLNATLPLSTQILIDSSRWFGRYGLFAFLGLVAVFVAANRAVKTGRGRLLWHRFLLKVPLLRRILAASIYANLARTLGTLMANGVPVVQALGIVENTVGNAVIAQELRNARDRVTDGTSISGPLAAGKVFPPIMTDMLAIGEQTGDMTAALEHIGRRYESELERGVKLFTTVLEPVLIVIIAVLVGYVAISMLLAVLNLTSGLQV